APRARHRGRPRARRLAALPRSARARHRRAAARRHAHAELAPPLTAAAALRYPLSRAARVEGGAMRRTAFVSFLWVLAGCGGGAETDIEASLVFADRTDLELVRLINASVLTEVFTTEAQIEQLVG